MNIIGIDYLGYSTLDWEYARRKHENPDIAFEDILREKMGGSYYADPKSDNGTLAEQQERKM